MIVAGECLFEGASRPFLCKINLETNSADVIKVLSIEDKITQVNFGPYDNGYVLVGLESGQLIVFDMVHLDKV